MSIASVKLYSALPASKYRLSHGLSKRWMDIGLIILIAPFALTIMTVISAALLMGGKPVLYSQIRVGQGGQSFRLWKFCSMVPDADRVLQEYLSQNSDAAMEWRHTRKLRHDPRITRPGRILRKSSLDELPQLWNVLRGEMSLVGPRPVPREELREKYRGYAHIYLKCRPGLTGLWQVSGRNRLCYSDRVKLDAAYYVQQNLKLDIRVLWRTFGAVMRGSV